MGDTMSEDERQTNLPAQGEANLESKNKNQYSDTNLNEEHAVPSTSRTYQDDFDYKDNDTDPIIDEETDSPAVELGIPEVEFRDELDKYDVDDTGNEDDDMRETIEDRDEDDDNAASNTQ